VLLLVLAAGLTLQISETHFQQAKKEFGGMWQLRLVDSPIDAEKVESLRKVSSQEAEGIKYTGWTQTGRVELQNPDVERAVEVEKVLYYYGDNDVFFDLILKSGCALPEEMAFQIFGTDDVLGQTVLIDKKPYVVERIRYGESAILIAKVSKDSEIFFPVLNIRTDAADVFPLDELLFRSQISSNLVISYDSILGFPASLSKVFIPTKWSDFEFWSVAVGNLKGKISFYKEMKIYEFDQQFRDLIFMGIISRLIAFIFYGMAIWSVWKMRKCTLMPYDGRNRNNTMI